VSLAKGNHTNSLAKASYRQRVTHFTEEVSFLSESDKDWVAKNTPQRLSRSSTRPGHLSRWAMSRHEQRQQVLDNGIGRR
jgi:hypothetical protein